MDLGKDRKKEDNNGWYNNRRSKIIKDVKGNEKWRKKGDGEGRKESEGKGYGRKRRM